MCMNKYQSFFEFLVLAIPILSCTNANTKCASITHVCCKIYVTAVAPSMGYFQIWVNMAKFKRPTFY
uniref:Secreted protein n=1 Tax=Arundo donax TaxID=35708 RepID=A0A0A9CIM6_ARUDO